MSTSKSCTKCHRALLTSDFHVDRQKSDGLRKWCKTCSNKASADIKEAYPEREREINRAAVQRYWEANRDLINARRREAR